MARRAAAPVSIAESMLEEISSADMESSSLEQRLAAIEHLRATGVADAAVIDGFFVQRIARLRHAVAETQEKQDKLREMIGSLTAPPYFPAIYLANADAPNVAGALVQLGNERLVAQLPHDLPREQLSPGDEVFLSHERNCIIAKSQAMGMPTGDVATYSRLMPDGRFVLRSRDEEIVVVPRPSLREVGLKAGDSVRFDRSTGLALEKVESSKGEEHFLETTPADTFSDVGGLDREIEELKRVLTLHVFNPALASLYQVPRKRSVLMQGPPGNGKTKVARATCNWLAGMSPTGRALFINVKPGALNSMWFGQTEQHYREIFRVARQAAEADKDRCVVMFFDEVDSIGSARGNSVHEIHDRMLNAFMAELSGLEERGNIVILAATNRLEAMDPALLRPGRLGDLVLHFPQPNSRAARAILARHLPAGVPYEAIDGDQAAAREILLDQAIAQLFAQNTDTELANLTLRDGKRRLVRAADLVSGAQLESMAQSALERACIREAEGGPSGVSASDISQAVTGFFLSAARALTPHNARNYIHDLPQDVDVVRVELVERKVRHPHLYRMEAA